MSTTLLKRVQKLAKAKGLSADDEWHPVDELMEIYSVAMGKNAVFVSDEEPNLPLAHSVLKTMLPYIAPTQGSVPGEPDTSDAPDADEVKEKLKRMLAWKDPVPDIAEARRRKEASNS